MLAGAAHLLPMQQKLFWTPGNLGTEGYAAFIESMKILEILLGQLGYRT